VSEPEVLAGKPTLLEEMQVVGHVVLLKYRVSCGESQENRNNEREMKENPQSYQGRGVGQ
jgi:hypothetical protein